MADRIRFVDEPLPRDLERLEEEIDQFNYRTTGFHDGRSLAAFLRDESGALRAGLAGHTWGGCAQVVLSSHGFQAPAFYRRHGYVEVGRVEGYPRGDAQIYLRKALVG